MGKQRVDCDAGHRHLGLIALLDDADAVDDRRWGRARHGGLNSSEVNGIDAADRLRRVNVTIRQPGSGVVAIRRPHVKVFSKLAAHLMTKHPFAAKH